MTNYYLFVILLLISSLILDYKRDSSFFDASRVYNGQLEILKLSLSISLNEGNKKVMINSNKQLSANSTVDNKHSNVTSTAVKKLPQVSEIHIKDSVEYFPWNGRVNYDAVCNSLKEKLQSFDGPPIIHKGMRGGLGHKFSSLINIFITALVMKRPLSFVMPKPYWRNIDNCLKDMMTTVNYSNFRVCGKNRNCLAKRNRLNTLFNEPLVFEDYQPARCTDDNLKAINKLNLSIRFYNWGAFYRVIYRIVSNPKKDLIDQIVNATKGIDFKSVTTIHIRSGGALANHKERACWVTKDELPKLVKGIDYILSHNKLGRLVYLTTDSDIVYSYIRQYLKNVHFLTLNMYKRDHTTGSPKDAIYRSALFDLYVAAQGSSLLFSVNSGYSNAIRSLSHTRRMYLLPTTFRLLKDRPT